jgi:hypothetical protein
VVSIAKAANTGMLFARRQNNPGLVRMRNLLLDGENEFPRSRSASGTYFRKKEKERD